MKKYEVMKNTIEVARKDRKEIKEGIILTQDESFPEIITSFDALESAKNELSKHKSSIKEVSGRIWLQSIIYKKMYMMRMGIWAMAAMFGIYDM